MARPSLRRHEPDDRTEREKIEDKLRLYEQQAANYQSFVDDCRRKAAELRALLSK